MRHFASSSDGIVVTMDGEDGQLSLICNFIPVFYVIPDV
jgi:hypothetical protein